MPLLFRPQRSEGGLDVEIHTGRLCRDSAAGITSNLVRFLSVYLSLARRDVRNGMDTNHQMKCLVLPVGMSFEESEPVDFCVSCH